MNDVQYERLYERGMYDACVEEIEDLLKKLKNGCDISKMIATSRLDSKAVNFDLQILTLILEGNSLVSKYMILIESTREKDCVNWSLVDYYKKIRALSHSTNIIPLTLYLNSLYNSLWCLWVKEKFNDEDRDTMFDMLEDCARKVLLRIGVQEKHSSNDNRGEGILALMSRIVANLVHFEILECLQLIEICLLSIRGFICFEKSISVTCKSVIYALKSSWPQIEVKFRMTVTQDDSSKSNSKFLKLFKFGFLQLNDTTDYNLQQVNECLCVMLGSSLFELGYLPESADLLTSHLSEGCSKFLCAYIQAYIYLQMQKLGVSKMYILKMSRLAMSQYAEVQFNLLKGQHECSVGDTINAHSEFTKLLPSRKFKYAGLVHIFNNLTSSFHAFYDLSGKTDSNALLDKYIQVLRCFYSFTSNTFSEEESSGYNAEERIISVLHKGKLYHREDLVYLVGKQTLWIEVLHLSSDNSFNAASIAAKCYMDVLSTYYQRDPSLQLLNKHIQMIHEATIALILSGKINDAEIVCQILVQNCVPLKEEIKETILDAQEEFLLESGIAALLLLASIHFYQKKFDDANKLLTRVKKLLVQIYFSFHKSHTGVSLLDAIIAKVYVLKAVLYLKEGCKFDAFQSCQKAIIHNPDDDIIEECAKIAEKIGGEMAPPHQKKSFVLRQWTSVIFDYLLSVNFPF